MSVYNAIAFVDHNLGFVLGFFFWWGRFALEVLCALFLYVVYCISFYKTTDKQKQTNNMKLPNSAVVPLSNTLLDDPLLFCPWHRILYVCEAVVSMRPVKGHL